MSVEDTLLVDCLRFTLDSSQYAKPFLPAGVNWDSFFQTAIKNRAVGALLFVEKTIPGFWPEKFKSEITSYRYSFLLHADAAVQRVQAVLSELVRAGIPAIVMKGWEYIYTVYAGDYSLRPCGDIDILIHPDQLKTAEKVLAESGCNPVMELWPGFRYRYHNVAHHYQLDLDQTSPFDFGVDLHWGLFNRLYQDRLVQIEDVFNRALTLRIGDTAAYRLSTEDHILHACGHLSLHHGDSPGLYRYYELAWVIRNSEPALDWQVLFARAAQWKLQIPLQSTLTELERLFPGTVPATEFATLNNLHPDPEEQKTYNLLMKYRDTPFVHVLPFRWTPSALWESLSFLFEAFVPGPQFLQHRYGKIRFWPLHYLRRAGNSIKQLLAFSRK